MNDFNDLSVNLTGKNIGDLAGNVTETMLHKFIDSTPVGKIPFVDKSAKDAATRVARNVNQRISKTKMQGGNGNGKGGGGNNNGGGVSGFGNMTPPSGGNGPSKYAMTKTGGSYFPIERQATNPTPYQFTLNTGIKAPVYAPLYQNSVMNGNISMVMAAFSFKYTIDSFPISQFVQTVVNQVFYNAIQRAVNFSIGSTLTASALINWMNSLIKALNTYFYVKSILGYTNNPLNRNDALVSLRQGISATDLNYLYELERILLGTPIPPNLINFCYWLNGNYVDGNLPNSTVLKFFTLGSGSYTSVLGEFETNIDWPSLLKGLADNNNVSVLVSRATDWHKPDFPVYPDLPVYDSNWLTTFANTGVVTKDSHNTINFDAPKISSPVHSWAYNTFTNELDGLALALNTVFDVVNGVWLPNLGFINIFSDRTVAGNYTNRLKWQNGSWKNANLLPHNCDVFTHLTSHTAGNSYVNLCPGSEVVLGVNESSVTQAGIQLAEWLFSIDTIGYVKDNRVYDSKFSNEVGFTNKNKRK